MTHKAHKEFRKHVDFALYYAREGSVSFSNSNHDLRGNVFLLMTNRSRKTIESSDISWVYPTGRWPLRLAVHDQDGNIVPRWAIHCGRGGPGSSLELEPGESHSIDLKHTFSRFVIVKKGIYRVSLFVDTKMVSFIEIHITPTGVAPTRPWEQECKLEMKDCEPPPKPMGRASKSGYNLRSAAKKHMRSWDDARVEFQVGSNDASDFVLKFAALLPAVCCSDFEFENAIPPEAANDWWNTMKMTPQPSQIAYGIRYPLGERATHWDKKFTGDRGDFIVGMSHETSVSLFGWLTGSMGAPCMYATQDCFHTIQWETPGLVVFCNLNIADFADHSFIIITFEAPDGSIYGRVLQSSPDMIEGNHLDTKYTLSYAIQSPPTWSVGQIGDIIDRLDHVCGSATPQCISRLFLNMFGVKVGSAKLAYTFNLCAELRKISPHSISNGLRFLNSL